MFQSYNFTYNHKSTWLRWIIPKKIPEDLCLPYKGYNALNPITFRLSLKYHLSEHMTELVLLSKCSAKKRVDTKTFEHTTLHKMCLFRIKREKTNLPTRKLAVWIPWSYRANSRQLVLQQRLATAESSFDNEACWEKNYFRLETHSLIMWKLRCFQWNNTKKAVKQLCIPNNSICTRGFASDLLYVLFAWQNWLLELRRRVFCHLGTWGKKCVLGNKPID